MKLNNKQNAFTLIEMLVVIAIIGILAGLVLYLGPTVHDSQKRKTVQAQMVQLDMIIEQYKAVKGYYPPTNPAATQDNAYLNTLYYELTGQALPSSVNPSVFGVGGIVNVSGNSTDWKNFFPDIKDNQWRELTGGARILGIRMKAPAGSTFADFCPWFYRPAPEGKDPTIHNSKGFDLWMTVELSKGPTLIGNWKDRE
jgi:prepilin-type N-terminal cleavage/methylation domain-containing protein